MFELNFTDQLLSRSGARTPRRGIAPYIIACAPRTGSTLLAIGLTRTELAGKPGEFFESKVRTRLMHELQVEADGDYIPKLLDAMCTSNRVFGTKMFWFHMNCFIENLLATTAIPLATPLRCILPSLLGAVIGTPIKYVWLRRRNKAAQAVSLYRAQSTEVWEYQDSSEEDRLLKFNFSRIDSHVKSLTQNESYWSTYFSNYQIEPLTVFYEEFIQSYEETIKEVLRFLDLPFERVVVAPPSLRRQANDRSLEWEVRYLELAGSCDWC